MPYPTYGVTSAATPPPMATAVSETVASRSTYTAIRESMPRRYDDDYHRPAKGVYMTGIPGYAAPETGYTMPAPGFTSLSGLRGPESCRGRSKGSGRSSNKSLTRSEIREALRGATADLVGEPETGYTMPAPGLTSLSGLRGPESCRGSSKGSGRSSNKSLTRSEIREALRGATADLVGDLIQEIRAKLQPLILPQG